MISWRRLSGHDNRRRCPSWPPFQLSCQIPSSTSKCEFAMIRSSVSLPCALYKRASAAKSASSLGGSPNGEGSAASMLTEPPLQRSPFPEERSRQKGGVEGGHRA